VLSRSSAADDGNGNDKRRSSIRAGKFGAITAGDACEASSHAMRVPGLPLEPAHLQARWERALVYRTFRELFASRVELFLMHRFNRGWGFLKAVRGGLSVKTINLLV
jgi:hypothetical protein